MNQKFFPKNRKIGKGWTYLLTYLERRNCRKPSEVFRFCTTSSTFFEIGLFIWLNSLVRDVPNSYPQYHLILSFIMQNQSFEDVL